nr:unnamed protein product [Callosobruchus chinensis]
MSEVTGISRTSIQRILKHYKWHPYKIQLLHELNEDDHDRLSHCGTQDGSLVENIMGDYSFKETEAMKRSKSLEKQVVAALEKIENIKIHKCGFILNKNFPIVCVSPDGITDELVQTLERTSCNWLTHGKRQPQTEGFLIDTQDQVIKNNNYRKYILKDGANDTCRRCRKANMMINKDYLIFIDEI